ncbi:DUF4402 domain-containing protein [Salinimicrobium gaetbulicola]|uniref:DUF4402 domain-containing protein n=1 Tax=Salinimicrobium gaetbulicola TaxID=999702 RepID=A0ABW3ICT0_9FLAO
MHFQILSIPKIIILGSFILITSQGLAQQITIDGVVGSLDFGTFAKASGGTITLNGDGSVSSTGDIYPLKFGKPRSVASIEISTTANTTGNGNGNGNGNAAKVVNITSLPTTLIGGTGILELSLNFSDNNFFLPQNTPKTIYMGGTLTVGGPEDPSGIYSGTVDVTVDVIFTFQ